MAESKKGSSAKETPAAKAASAGKPEKPAGQGSDWADGYQGLDWHLYQRVRPHVRHSGATGAGLVEYTLWFEVITSRPAGDRKDVPLPGQPVR